MCIDFTEILLTGSLHFNSKQNPCQIQFSSIFSATDYAGLQTRVTSEEIVVDITPPVPGQIVIDSLSSTRWISGDVLRVLLMDFLDKESGIDYFAVFVGSFNYRMDIVAETTYRDDVIEINLQDTNMMDGHVYYLGAKVKRLCIWSISWKLRIS